MGEGLEARQVVVGRADYDRFCTQLRRVGNGRLLDQASKWVHEPTAPRLNRLANEARRLGRRVGLGALEVFVDSNDVCLPPDLTWLWGLLPHLVRNAIDHGLRETLSAQLWLRTSSVDGELLVEVRDNGQGIQWERIKELAKEAGLRAETREDLIAALFRDRLTTKDTATDISGRGVGLSVVRACAVENGATIEVDSEVGEGTTIRLRVPLPQASVSTTGVELVGSARA